MMEAFDDDSSSSEKESEEIEETTLYNHFIFPMFVATRMSSRCSSAGMGGVVVARERLMSMDEDGWREYLIDARRWLYVFS